MADSGEQRGDFGSLERWTVGLFAVTFVFSIFTWIPALVCLAYSKCWTLAEKLAAALGPMIVGSAIAAFYTYGSPVQDWIRIPLILTLSGVLPLLSAVFLYARARSPWPSSA